jgi:hypothetical protein
MPRNFRLLVLACLCMCVGNLALAQDRLWRPYVELEGRGTSIRQLGQGNLFLPLTQDSESLLFADLRGVWTDAQAAEGNWGLAYRKILPSEWIVGAHLFYDLRHSEQNNNFHQGTAGVELLNVNWGFRFNGYIPDQGVKLAQGLSQAFLQGNNIVVRPGLEAAYWGVDFEAERLLWCREGNYCDCRSPWDPRNLDAELWAAAGVFHFDNDTTDFQNVTGPRIRAELRMYDLPMIGDDSRLVISGQYEYDDVRGSVGTGMLTVRIPFGPGGGRSGYRMSALERRMVT